MDAKDILNDARRMAESLNSQVTVNADNALELLEIERITVDTDFDSPQVCLSIVDGSQDAIIGTLGNFSLVIGKAKSRKTFFVSIAVAAAVKNDIVLNKVRGILPTTNGTVLYFDTEQGKYHVQQVLKRICANSGINHPEQLRMYGIRKYTPSERSLLIEEAIYQTDGVGLVVIDGIRDLITSINDEEQATGIASKLLKWTEERNIHIVCVLHMNKGDTNARGHLGTELQNKAESVLSIKKDEKQREYSIVEAEYCREKDFSPFTFTINEIGIPEIDTEYANTKNEARKMTITPQSIPRPDHISILNAIFKECTDLTYSKLYKQIKLRLADRQINIGDSKAKEFIEWYLNQGYLMPPEVKNTRHSYYLRGRLLDPV